MSTVGDVMIRNPKTLAARASIEETRVALANDHVHMVLLIDGCELVGTLVRADLVGAKLGAGPALPLSTIVGRTVPPEAEVEAVQRQLVDLGLRRLAVVDPHGALLGLVCLKQSRTGFCSDANVASRATDIRTSGSAPQAGRMQP